jgi:hypothetical protein
MKETNSKRENFNRTETNSSHKERYMSDEKCKRYWEFCEFNMKYMEDFNVLNACSGN